MRGGWGPLELTLQRQGDSQSDCDMPFASVESFTPCLGKGPPDSVQLENSVHVSDLDLYQDTNLSLGSSSDVTGIIVWYMRPWDCHYLAWVEWGRGAIPWSVLSHEKSIKNFNDVIVFTFLREVIFRVGWSMITKEVASPTEVSGPECIQGQDWWRNDPVGGWAGLHPRNLQGSAAGIWPEKAFCGDLVLYDSVYDPISHIIPGLCHRQRWPELSRGAGTFQKKDAHLP